MLSLLASGLRRQLPHHYDTPLTDIGGHEKIFRTVSMLQQHTRTFFTLQAHIWEIRCVQFRYLQHACQEIPRSHDFMVCARSAVSHNCVGHFLTMCCLVLRILGCNRRTEAVQTDKKVFSPMLDVCTLREVDAKLLRCTGGQTVSIPVKHLLSSLGTAHTIVPKSSCDGVTAVQP